MKILLIDNGTSYLSQIEKLLSNVSFRVIRYSEITQTSIEDFDAVILSGGHEFPVYGSEDRLIDEMHLIKNFNKPIFGICFGFELIAYVFGAHLECMQDKERGILDIQVVESDDLFLNILNFQVFESHRWVIKKPVDSLKVLARSKDGIEAVKHKTRLIYGVQFHPEMFVEKTCGDEIFYNFLNLIK